MEEIIIKPEELELKENEIVKVSNALFVGKLSEKGDIQIQMICEADLIKKEN